MKPSAELPPGARRVEGEPPSWVERPRNVTRIYLGVWAVCMLSIVAQAFVHVHGYHWWEELFGFHGWFGLGACVFLVLAAKLMRPVVMRREDYYD